MNGSATFYCSAPEAADDADEEEEDATDKADADTSLSG